MEFNINEVYNNQTFTDDVLNNMGGYNNERLGFTTVMPNRIDENIDQDISDRVANEIAEKEGFQQPKYIESGSFGHAYSINSHILKITTDKSEALENVKLLGKRLNRIAQPLNVYSIKSKTENIPELYGIVLERLKTDCDDFYKKFQRLSYVVVKILGYKLGDFFEYYFMGDKGMDIDNEKVMQYFKKNPSDFEYFNALLEIQKELKSHGVNSKDFLNPCNLGYKEDGTIAYFDIGNSNLNQKFRSKPQDIEVTEDGSAKFSSQDAIGRVDQSMSPGRVVNDDAFDIDERDVSGMEGSVAVKVKDKCKLGGLGNTSVACNQGDINNLKFEPIKEEILGSVDNNELKDKNRDDIIPLVDDLKSFYDRVKNNEYLSADDVDDLLHIFMIYHYNTDVFSDVVPRFLINFMIRNLKHQGLLKEEIDASESNTSEKTFNALVSGKKDIGILSINDVSPDKLKNAGLKGVKIKQEKDVDDSNNVFIVYKPHAINNAVKLYRIMMKHGGYAGDKTPEEAYEIGKLLGYTDDSINDFIRKKYGKYRNKETGDYVSTTPIYHDTNEGVGDEYLKKKHGIETDDDKFEKQYQKHLSYEKNVVVYNKNNLTIIKNPQSLVHIGSDVRGIIVRNGDLYLEQSSHATHDKLIDVLHNLGIVNAVGRDWAIIPLELPKELVGVQRRGYYNEIYLSESHLMMIDDEEVRERLKNSMFYREGDLKYEYDEAAPYFKPFLDKARQKCPNIKFFNASIYKFDDMYDDELYDDNIAMNENEIMTLDDLSFKDEIQKRGGKIYSVGGAVRDDFLGKESKDLDILITGIPIKELESILSKYGSVDAVGKSFGILKFNPDGVEIDEPIDVAIPRTEVPTGGGGHKDFDVKSDHSLPIEKDLERRDFTINAIAKDINGNIIDPYGGMDDIKNKVIRIVNPDAFSDDPLRMLRAVQFASRFNFKIEPKTMALIKKNANKINEIPGERILTEFDKIVNKGNVHEGAFQLKNTGLLKNIFGSDDGISLDSDKWKNVQTMGEFIWMLSNNLVENPADFYKKELNGDINTYKEIKALSHGMSDNIPNDAYARIIAHNVYTIYPEALKSKILPNEIQNAGSELLNNKYPKTIKDLNINGNDLMQLGFEGKEIGDTLKNLLIKIYSDELNNNKDDLLNYVKNIKDV